MVLYLLLFLMSTSLQAYYLPSMNLGLTNFLDGGSPTPGFYWIQFYGYSYTPVYMDERGKPYPNELSQQFNNLTSVFLGVVDTKVRVAKAWLGFDVAQPVTLYNHVDHNDFNVKSTTAGLGDFAAGVFLQWDPIMKDDRKIFQTRLELITSFPTGKTKRPDVDPGKDCYVVNPYWAATYFFLPHWGLSWRVNYAWSSQKKKSRIFPGHVLFINYDLEVEAYKDVWVGMNAYYLQQLTDSKCPHHHKMHRSKEQALAFGPGGVAFLPHDFTMVFNLYFEVLAKNRAESTRFIWRLIKRF